MRRLTLALRKVKLKSSIDQSSFQGGFKLLKPLGLSDFRANAGK